MDKNLRAYIERESKKGVIPSAIRYSLLQAGWPQQVVDHGMAEFYGKTEKRKSSTALMLIGLIVIIALGALILIVTLKPIEVQPNNPPQVTPPPTTGANECLKVDSSEQKDLCYQSLVAKGYDCGTLSDEVEKAYCFRALDYYLTKN